MSSLIIEVCLVDSVRPHPNADRMAVAKIKGWEVCVAKGDDGEPWVKPGDKVVYFPPESIIPADVAEKHGVTKYLAALPKREDGTRPAGGRVVVANLRSFKSYGYLAKPDDPDWEVGKDLVAYYGVTKYEPPIRATQGDAEKDNPAFHRYFDMENLRNFPDAFSEGEDVMVTEKIHGQNCRLGLIRETNDAGVRVWKWAAGSHDVRRKRFAVAKPKFDEEGNPLPTKPGAESEFWKCFTPEIKKLLCSVSWCGYSPEQIDNEPPVVENESNRLYDVVLFGERYGGGVQDMWYGCQAGEVKFRAFDITVNGQYLKPFTIHTSLSVHDVPSVPILYQGPYSFEKMVELTEGPSSASSLPEDSAKNFKEGVVITACSDRQVELRGRVGRAQLKLISFAYSARKNGTEFH